jgi:hypothetical protein
MFSRSPRVTHVDVVGKILYLRPDYHFGPGEIASACVDEIVCVLRSCGPPMFQVAEIRSSVSIL